MIFDQHFMIDNELINRIINYANISEDDIILEIGPGTGNLTKELKKKTNNLILVEKDETLADKLKDYNIIKGNILNEISKIKFTKIVANIPYDICEPLLNKLIKLNFKLAILTVPKKFSLKIKSNKTVLGLIMPLFFKIDLLEEVPESAFDPKPKVKSAIIKLIPLNKKSIIQEIYLQQDKKLKNALIKSIKRIKKISNKDIKSPELNFLDKKVYTLNQKEWKELVDTVVVQW